MSSTSWAPRFAWTTPTLTSFADASVPLASTLHGGRVPFDPAQYFEFADGRFYNGLSVVGINLMDVNPGDGGFGCVPGSHKSNLPFPADWKNLDDTQPIVERVTGPAGTAIFFTEALTHGALPWTSAAERRTIFYKYSPEPARVVGSLSRRRWRRGAHRCPAEALAAADGGPAADRASHGGGVTGHSANPATAAWSRGMCRASCRRIRAVRVGASAC